MQANARRILTLLTLALVVLCAAINSAKLDSELANWIQRTSRVEAELKAIDSVIGNGAGSNSLLILQTPHNQDHDEPSTSDVLTVEALMVHLEAMAIATHVTIDLFDINWSLKDICFSPTPPDYEGLLANQMLEHLMPCAIKTPLDCFWEGAKLLGPEQEVRMGSIGPKLKWTNLNPLLMVEAKRRAHPHASFPYGSLIDWMRRVGINSGYLERPCLDPTDPNCPTSAPNKLSNLKPDIGARLTGGCYGLATKQMHWREEEILGGVVRNRSGYINRAEALQSTIQLMGEQDMYDYWRKTSKVQDINNWSTEKAKLVLDMWQRRFKEELARFTRSSIASNSYKIHVMTPKSLLEPIEVDSILDITNFKLAIIAMTIFTCIFNPNFESPKADQQTGSRNNFLIVFLINRFKLTLLAIITSIFVGLTFIASLGLSSFMNLPFNMATIQTLHPLALYYGFSQALMIANVYSRNYKRVPSRDLTTECLNELLPVIMIESTIYIIPLLVATVIPVPATRVFAFQAITFVVLSTFISILLMPSLLITFLRYYHDQDEGAEEDQVVETTQVVADLKQKSRSSTPSKPTGSGVERLSIEEQIFSRLQDDLKNIKADPIRPTDFNFSADFRTGDGLRTSLRLTASQLNRCDYSLEHNDSCWSSSKDAQGPHSDQTGLPDLLQWPPAPNLQTDTVDPIEDGPQDEKEHQIVEDPHNQARRCLAIYSTTITSNRFVQMIVCLVKLSLLVAILSQVSKVRYGLHVKDIVTRGSPEFESFQIQERYFPIYNIFVITRGNFDYPSNQRLLHEFFERIQQVDGIVRDDENVKPKFWLAHFRDWLLELQDRFDADRNNSLISSEGWSQDASDASKLAYKLLAQTGKVDNPIDKGLVEFNRLVDKNGIINQRAFYYYLTAWVMNDAFSYSNSEANFRPEPKSWNENPDDLRIERARPLIYTQVPFLVKLPSSHDNLKTITEIRSISQAFEQLNLPNFPTGIPFIFWDQYINLDLLFFAAIVIIVALLYLAIGLATADLQIAAIIMGPILMTLLELYGIVGYLSIPFNNIVAVLMISTIGNTAIQTVHYTSVSPKSPVLYPVYEYPYLTTNPPFPFVVLPIKAR